MRKSAAAPRAIAGYAAGGAAAPDAGALRTEVRTFAGCEGEAVRRVETDARGRVVRYVREGTFRGRRVEIEHVFLETGRADAVRLRGLDAPLAPEEARALSQELLPSFPRTAAEAGIDAPPHCGR
jgi:hypothetical protein